ncbi:hypothetical protein GCM10023322_79230 [Rugosimonospora acidiphila]|uniref:Uncharacterized protein n=1 Tax=Rugosimonospora acidiphila TaxID=556531 RepID=A0ABP9ST62_9ACTN
MIGVLRPRDVRTAPAYLSRLPLEDWAQRYPAKLDNAVPQLAYSRPFHGQWTKRPVEATRGRATVIQLAAA